VSHFEIIDKPLRGLKVFEREIIRDARGYFERMFCSTELDELIAGMQIVQINHTLTKQRGVVRGMHFQYPPHAEIKLVSCLRGEIFDVAVDLRAGSPTFLQWHAERLTAENGKTLCIPQGFAHGFQTLTEDCEMLYLHTAAYAPAFEGGVSPLDPRVAIAWPLAVTSMSERDASHEHLSVSYSGIEP
jgi:dTDP-4-dehydrorhamnose 3,5-epimerase